MSSELNEMTGFIYYYLYQFDLARSVATICVTSGTPNSKSMFEKQLPWRLAIEDPFLHGKHDLGKVISASGMPKIRKALTEKCNHLFPAGHVT